MVILTTMMMIDRDDDADDDAADDNDYDDYDDDDDDDEYEDEHQFEYEDEDGDEEDEEDSYDECAVVGYGKQEFDVQIFSVVSEPGCEGFWPAMAVSCQFCWAGRSS